MKEMVFGLTKKGETVRQYELSCKKMKIVISEYGAAVQTLMVSDANGILRDVVLGYDTLQEYEIGNEKMGAVIGRIANRVSGASVFLEGKEYTLDKNDGENCRDGGFCGFHRRVWKNVRKSTNELTFSLDSRDGDQGIPGNLHIEVTYSLNEDMEFSVRYYAESDKDSFLNLTNRIYFNLHGQGNGDIMDHVLQIYSDKYMPLRGEDRIPDGTIQNVFSTAFDFGYPKRIGRELYSEDIQLKYGNGYDHNYLIALNKGTMKTIANVKSEKTGIGMEVRSSMPGMQFCTGNEIEVQKGKGKATYYPHSGFVLEPQYWPDSMNTKGFLPCAIRAGVPWKSETVYRFYQLW